MRWSVFLVALALIGSAAAYEGTFDSGWGNCDPSGYYGGDNNCKVVWDQPCTEAQKNATFSAGIEGMHTNLITIEHLDGIAETTDGFDVIGQDGGVFCEFTDNNTLTSEDWKTLNCNADFSGVQTFTIVPKAETPWSMCSTYGQVAVRSITFTTDGEIPEFGVIAAVVAIAGALGVVIYKRRH